MVLNLTRTKTLHQGAQTHNSFPPSIQKDSVIIHSNEAFNFQSFEQVNVVIGSVSLRGLGFMTPTQHNPLKPVATFSFSSFFFLVKQIQWKQVVIWFLTGWNRFDTPYCNEFPHGWVKISCTVHTSRVFLYLCHWDCGIMSPVRRTSECSSRWYTHLMHIFEKLIL